RQPRTPAGIILQQNKKQAEVKDAHEQHRARQRRALLAPDLFDRSRRAAGRKKSAQRVLQAFQDASPAFLLSVGDARPAAVSASADADDDSSVASVSCAPTAPSRQRLRSSYVRDTTA